MSATPLTDAEAFQARHYHAQGGFSDAIRGRSHNPEDNNCVDVDFARKLETALRQIHDLTYPYADGAVDACAHDKLCARISDITREFVPLTVREDRAE